MKKTLSIVAVMASYFGMAQNKSNIIHCNTIEYEKVLQKNDPGRKNSLNQLDQHIQLSGNLSTSRTTADTVINIPVVVHVLYCQQDSAAQNISDQRIFNQIRILNEDFNATNPDTNKIPRFFKPLLGKAKFQFCLAQTDPRQNPTNGIVRKRTDLLAFDGASVGIKVDSLGGDDAWPTDKYFNIWVGNLNRINLFGYAEFPANTATQTYGFVSNYRIFGGIDPADSYLIDYSKGRTATHEVGHCFGLLHIWGDEPFCANDDGIADTPPQKDKNFGKPLFPQDTSKTGGCCNMADSSSMFMNYMDYTDQDAMFMFTKQQVTSMRNTLNNSPYRTLAQSTVCQPLTAIRNNPAVMGISFDNLCDDTLHLKVNVTNWGTDTLKSLKVSYMLDAGTPVVHNWTGQLPKGHSTTIYFLLRSPSATRFKIKAYVAEPNGANDDIYTLNDSLSKQFKLPVTVNAAYTENFVSPANNISYYNSHSYNFWQHSTTGALDAGSMSLITIPFTNLIPLVSEFTLPDIKWNNRVNADTLSFYMAYRIFRNNVAFIDTLKVLISDDCEASWKVAYTKAGTSLATVTDTTRNYFQPTATQWRKEKIILAPYHNLHNLLRIKFSVIAYSINSVIYFDNINVDTSAIRTSPKMTLSLGDNKNEAVSDFTIYPNPSTGKFVIELNQVITNETKVEVKDVLGNTVKVYTIGANKNNLNADLSAFDNGMYFIVINTHGKQMTKRIMLSK